MGILGDLANALVVQGAGTGTDDRLEAVVDLLMNAVRHVLRLAQNAP